MRHFRSFLYAVVLGPAVWVLVAVGLAHESLTGLVMLLLGGAAYALLAFAPISPFGPALAGAAFLVGGVWAVSWPSSYGDAWPHGTGSDLSRPGHGLAAVLAVPLLLTVLSVRRWRGDEPLVVPFVGQMGRKRESAVVPPEDPTTLLRLFEEADDRTTLLRRPSAESEPTTVVRLPPDGEVTTILRSPGAGDGRSELPTEDVWSESSHDGRPADDQPTEDVGQESPTVVVSDERPTADVAPTLLVAEEVDGEMTAVIVAGTATAEDDAPAAGLVAAGAEQPDEEPTTTAAAAGPTTESPDEPLTEPFAAVTEPDVEAEPADDEPTTVVAVADETRTEAPAIGDAGSDLTIATEPAGDAADDSDQTDEELSTATGSDKPAEAGRDTASGEVRAATPGDEESAEAVAAEIDAAALTEQQAAAPAADQETASAELDAAAISRDSSDGQEPAEVVVGGAAAEFDEAVAVGRSGVEEVTGEVGRPADEVTGPVGVKSDDGVADLEPVADGRREPVVARVVGVGEAVAEVGDLPVVGVVGAEAAGVLAEEAEERPAVGAVAAGASAEPVVVEETTYLIVPDDGEQATAYRVPGERTVVMRPPGFVPGEATQVLGTVGEETRIILRRDVDDTQVIRLPDDGERTQVLGFSRAARTAGPSRGGPSGASPSNGSPSNGDPSNGDPSNGGSPNGDPSSGNPSSDDQPGGDYPEQDRAADDHPAGRRPPAQRGGSIAGAESPNFADDPTGRLVFPVAQPEEPARSMTVMNMERPPEVPAPRKSPESED